MTQAQAYAATSPSAPLPPFTFERRAPGELDVALDVLYCGVCHSGLHTARNEWKNTLYPSVPGREIVGRVTAIGMWCCSQRRRTSARMPCGWVRMKSWSRRTPMRWRRRPGKLDFILNTVAAPHDLDAFLALLKLDATMTLVGAPDSAHPSPNVFSLIIKRRRLAGSLIGGIRETQEMLDFCAQHGIVSDIEMIRMDEIDGAYERMLRSDVKYRFVVDVASLA